MEVVKVGGDDDVILGGTRGEDPQGEQIGCGRCELVVRIIGDWDS